LPNRRILLLDAGPLGMAAHPKPRADFQLWLDNTLAAGDIVVVPEITDYEVRRNLILAGLTASLARLDALKMTLAYQSIDTFVMLKAAELWAEARNRGRTTADPKELNGDVILAAQALQVGGIIVTENAGHLQQFVEAKTWKELT
jgi:predicted nucleic acid-binding protein